MSKVIILRGLTGSGKTTWAKSFLMNSNVGTCTLVSANNFFEVDGEYKFDATKLQQAHDSCFRDFTKLILLHDQETIIVDNTNSTIREYSFYVILAEICGFEVMVKEFKCNGTEDLVLFHKRAIHNVPLHIMQNMYRRWEEDPAVIIHEHQ